LRSKSSHLGRRVVEVKIERGCILESMELHGNLCRDWFHLSIGQLDISNDGINQGTLSKFIGSILHPYDVDSHVISWMSLVLDVQANVLDLPPDDLLELFIILA
jgi:hypothetical protein